MKVPLTARDLIAKTSQPERVYDICLDAKAKSERDAVQLELDDAKQAGSSTMAGDPRIAELTARLEELDAQVAEGSVPFRFRGLSHWRFKEIQRRFPTEERGMSWDVDAGGPTLVSECLVDPALTPEEVRELLEHGNQQLANEFISAAMIVCQQGNEVPKSARGSASSRGSASK
jgi:hypothetical protein